VLLLLGIILVGLVWNSKIHAVKAAPVPKAPTTALNHAVKGPTTALSTSFLSVTVNPYPTPFTVYEVGSTMSHVLAAGTDQLGPGDPITATIDWGDKTTPTQYTSIDGRTFQISGSHAYSRVGKYTITVTAAITAFQQSASGTGTITVVPAYTLNARNILYHPGHPFNSTIATGSDPIANDPLQGTIDWGDQTTPTSVKVTSSTNGLFQLKATHTYSQAGSWTITVSLSSFIVGPIQATASAAVFTLKANSITVQAGQPFTRTIATILGNISAAGMRVNIEWGDNTLSKMNLPGGNGPINVKGGHLYSQPGTYTILIGMRDFGTGEQAVVSATITVV
jgi:hypothetical protein